MNKIQDTPSQSSFSLTERVKLLSKVAVVWQDKILVLKRPPGAFARPNAWDLPGGNHTWPKAKKWVENPHLSDILREVWEETGLEISKDRLIPLAVFSGYTPQKKLYAIVIGWKYTFSTLKRPKILLSQEHSNYQWATKQQALKLDFGKGGEYLKKIVRQAFASRQHQS